MGKHNLTFLSQDVYVCMYILLLAHNIAGQDYKEILAMGIQLMSIINKQ
jgi:hypothetical protein